MLFLEYIEMWPFIIALGLGLLFTYITTPYPRVVYKYPTPYNAGKITYVDEADVCYKYKVNKVTCPLDQSKIKHLELQQETTF